MEDYIPRSQVKEALRKSEHWYVSRSISTTSEKLKTYLDYDEIATRLRNISDSIEVDKDTRILKWVNCKKDYPKLYQRVMVTIWDNQFDIGWFKLNKGGKLIFSTSEYELDVDEIKEIIAWMELPSMYEVLE